jgi:3-hydroxyisobutyrate dehydrogenase
MASSVSRIKVEKMLNEDFTAQAAIFDVKKNNRLISDEARDAKIASPLLNACHELFGEALKLGHSHCDMAAVLLALRERTRCIADRRP